MKHPLIEITDVSDKALDVYARLTDRQLRDERYAGADVMIAESPKVISRALDAGYYPLSILCERRHITGDAAEIIARCPEEMPVYTADREVLSSLTGYTLTRGVLCAMLRKDLPSVCEVCHGARRVAVLDGIVDSTNVGTIFRSAAALGIDAILMTRSSCDPLNRRAIRVSMGNVFMVPWAWTADSISDLHNVGFKTAAMALTDESVGIANEQLGAEPRLAIMLGNEGEGLSPEVIRRSDYVVKIPMREGVDSLNVAMAATIAFWQLR